MSFVVNRKLDKQEPTDSEFITDIEKYNDAALTGWRVFHLTFEIVQTIKASTQNAPPPPGDVKQM